MGEKEYESWKRDRTKLPPSILYKYATFKTAQCILQNQTLRFASPLTYNDPLDSQWDILWTVKTDEAVAYLRSLVRNAITKPESIPTNAPPKYQQAFAKEQKRIDLLPEVEREEKIAELINKLTETLMNEGSFPLWMRDIRRRLRVLCLTEDSQSILMWSHYADQHRGVVFGFDTTELEAAFKRPLEPIKYQDVLPRLADHQAYWKAALFGTDYFMNQERQWALIKYTDWKYEREWRYLWVEPTTTADDFTDFQFPASSLVELSIGLKTPDAEANELIGLLGRHDKVQRLRMTLAKDSFELVRTRVST
jgi:hypothetical protein